MNKTKLIEDVQASTGMTREEARNAVDAVVNAIRLNLRAYGQMQLNSFGHFAVRRQKQRVGSHPGTREPLPIPARNYVTFRPSTQLTNVLNDDQQ